MEVPNAYWTPVCALAHRLRCQVRVRAGVDGTPLSAHWRRLLILPTAGYLEGPCGPVRIRDVDWVDLATERRSPALRATAGETVSLRDAIIADLRQTRAIWKVHRSTWSIDRIDHDRPIEVVRVINPFSERLLRGGLV